MIYNSLSLFDDYNISDCSFLVLHLTYIGFLKCSKASKFLKFGNILNIKFKFFIVIPMDKFKSIRVRI